MNLHSLFKDSIETEEFSAGDVIFERGSSGKIMYVVLDGEVDISIDDNVIESLSSGDILGEMALIDKSVRSTTAVAKSDCRLAVADEKRFLFLVQQTPFFSLHVMKVLADRLRHMNQVSAE